MNVGEFSNWRKWLSGADSRIATVGCGAFPCDATARKSVSPASSFPNLTEHNRSDAFAQDETTARLILDAAENLAERDYQDAVATGRAQLAVDRLTESAAEDIAAYKDVTRESLYGPDPVEAPERLQVQTRSDEPTNGDWSLYTGEGGWSDVPWDQAGYDPSLLLPAANLSSGVPSTTGYQAVDEYGIPTLENGTGMQFWWLGNPSAYWRNTSYSAEHPEQILGRATDQHSWDAQNTATNNWWQFNVTSTFPGVFNTPTSTPTGTTAPTSSFEGGSGSASASPDPDAPEVPKQAERAAQGNEIGTRTPGILPQYRVQRDIRAFLPPGSFPDTQEDDEADPVLIIEIALAEGETLSESDLKAVLESAQSEASDPVLAGKRAELADIEAQQRKLRAEFKDRKFGSDADFDSRVKLYVENYGGMSPGYRNESGTYVTRGPHSPMEGGWISPGEILASRFADLEKRKFALRGDALRHADEPIAFPPSMKIPTAVWDYIAGKYGLDEQARAHHVIEKKGYKIEFDESLSENFTVTGKTVTIGGSFTEAKAANLVAAMRKLDVNTPAEKLALKLDSASQSQLGKYVQLSREQDTYRFLARGYGTIRMYQATLSDGIKVIIGSIPSLFGEDLFVYQVLDKGQSFDLDAEFKKLCDGTNRETAKLYPFIGTYYNYQDKEYGWFALNVIGDAFLIRGAINGAAQIVREVRRGVGAGGRAMRFSTRELLEAKPGAARPEIDFTFVDDLVQREGRRGAFSLAKGIEIQSGLLELEELCALRHEYAHHLMSKYSLRLTELTYRLSNFAAVAEEFVAHLYATQSLGKAMQFSIRYANPTHMAIETTTYVYIIIRYSKKQGHRK